ncbi:unnamed protein product [Clavelina lepadiformis]|uniref:Uncharacterized protein n=1 Tax=Clavelina lepadiformis TaxID=159417 RepID=A0ABP0FDY3_CLALP
MDNNSTSVQIYDGSFFGKDSINPLAALACAVALLLGFFVVYVTIGQKWCPTRYRWHRVHRQDRLPSELRRVRNPSGLAHTRGNSQRFRTECRRWREPAIFHDSPPTYAQVISGHFPTPRKNEELFKDVEVQTEIL